MVEKLLPQHLLSLGTGKVSQRHVGALPLLLRARRGAIRSREDRASALSTFAGARGVGGWSETPCKCEVERIKLTPLETEYLGERWPTSE
jgi:hypothetical protein